jgi:DNA-directed RNA polymerase subunit E'/Rpb7
MFIKCSITRVVIVEPQFLGRDLLGHVRKQCAYEVMGHTLGDVGLVVAILVVTDIGKGVIDDLMGSVRFTVVFDALCFRVIRNEVLDAEVETCWSNGLVVTVGPGLAVYVDVGCLPSDMHFVASGEGDYWATEAGDDSAIRKGSSVRVRIINPTKGDRHVAAVGTLTDPGLGLQQ